MPQFRFLFVFAVITISPFNLCFLRQTFISIIGMEAALQPSPTTRYPIAQLTFIIIPKKDKFGNTYNNLFELFHVFHGTDNLKMVIR